MIWDTIPRADEVEVEGIGRRRREGEEVDGGETRYWILGILLNLAATFRGTGFLALNISPAIKHKNTF